MACTVFTRLFHGANLFPRSHRSSPRAHTDQDGIDAKPSISSSAILETTPSLKREAAIMISEQSPREYASIELLSVPNYLTPAQLEGYFSTLPQLLQVRKATTVRRIGFYDLILDFEPGVNVTGLLDIGNSRFFVLNNHSLGHVNVRSAYPADEYEIISKLVVQPSVSGSPEVNHDTGRSVQLDRTVFGPPTCHFCFDELADQPLSTPCLICHQSQCYACVERQFLQALTDFETFPAKCCGVALYPEVIKGILSDEDYKRYRIRFEEWLSKDKLYCPVPTCSAFIPWRLRTRIKGGDLRCHECNVVICAQCKEVAHSSEQCATKTGKDDLIAVLTRFGYKQCPRCKSAVAKMHGCNHVACKCGAHWCWDCKRKIEDCNADPCEDHPEGQLALYEYSEEHDNESVISTDDETEASAGYRIADEERLLAPQVATDPLETNMKGGSETNRDSSDVLLHQIIGSDVRDDLETQPGPTEEMLHQLPEPSQSLNDDQPVSEELQRMLQHHEAMFLDRRTLPGAQPPSRGSTTDDSIFTLSTQHRQSTDTSPTNLDDPTTESWEHGEYDFGEEPTEDDRLDVWGCQHNFADFTQERIPRYWMTASDELWWERNPREIVCMRCWEPARVVPMTHQLAEMDKAERKRWQKSARAAKRCNHCGVVMCRRCKQESRNGDII